MSVSSVHPKFNEYQDDWELCRDSYDLTPIKEKRDKYLPPTSGHIIDGFPSENTLGTKSYNAYLMRAHYPDIYGEAVAAAIGVMHRKEPTITLPSQMEGLLTKATKLGEGLVALIRRVNTEQLTTGRVGLLLDINSNPDNTVEPLFVLYRERAIRNWDDTTKSSDVSSFRLVVLDESSYELTTGLSWEYKESYLVLALTQPSEIGEGLRLTTTGEGVYAYAKADETTDIESLEFTPATYRAATLDEVPFVTINASDINPNPDNPPLLGLANLCLLIYRGEADYRQSLFMQGQDTFVTIGKHTETDEALRTGAGSHVSVPMGGDAKYVGVSSQGVPEQRQALENDYKRAYSKSGQISDATSRAKESGDALRIRVSAQTATLPQIAMAGAAGIEKLLKIYAKWIGANPDEVSIQPNLEFTNDELSAKTLLELAQAKAQGAPVARKTIHDYMREHKLTKNTYEEESDLIDSEEPGL